MDDERAKKHIEFLRIREILVECIKINNISLQDFHSIAFGFLIRHLKHVGAPKEEVQKMLHELIAEATKGWDSI